jgi:hypothetical protein
MKEVVTAEIDKDILERLNKYCLKVNTDRNTAVNQLLEQALNEENVMPDPNNIHEMAEVLNRKIDRAKAAGQTSVIIRLPGDGKQANCYDQLEWDFQTAGYHTDRQAGTMTLSWK